MHSSQGRSLAMLFNLIPRVGKKHNNMTLNNHMKKLNTLRQKKIIKKKNRTKRDTWNRRKRPLGSLSYKTTTMMMNLSMGIVY